MKKRFKARIYEVEEAQLQGVNISCNIIDDVKAPKWFTEFVETQFKPLARDVTDLKVRMTNVENDIVAIKQDIVVIKQDIKQINTRIDSLVAKNDLKE